jgi:hypothetical protein
MSTPRVPLRVFGGQPAPPELAGDLLLLLYFPAEARERGRDASDSIPKP